MLSDRPINHAKLTGESEIIQGQSSETNRAPHIHAEFTHYGR